MPDSFGARLRQQREARHVDLLAIASQTRIKLALLEALERDDVSHWPAGIFRRAYLRTYAEFIGLDPDVALREFLEVHPDPESVADALAAAAEAARRNGPPPTRLRTIVDSAIGSLAKLRPPAVERARPAGATAPQNEAPPALGDPWTGNAARCGQRPRRADGQPIAGARAVSWTGTGEPRHGRPRA